VHNLARGSLEQLDLIRAPGNQSSQHRSTSLVPLGQFLSSDSVRTLALVQPRNQIRATGISTTNIERPRDERTELIFVELDGALDVLVDAVDEGLDVGLQEQGGGGRGERE